MNTLRLGSTAALVMEWAKPFFTSPQAKKYIKCLDLSQGQDLLSACNLICPWYEQVILNRKYALTQHIRPILENTARPIQVIIPAAGFAPLGLELLHIFPRGNLKVLEFDLYGMDEKKHLYTQTAPQHANRITCTNQNLNRRHFSAVTLKKAGWNPHIPTIMLVEGISYYLSHSDMLNLLKPLANNTPGNLAVIEYLLPPKNCQQSPNHIGKQVFDHITNYCHLEFVTHYSHKSLSLLLQPLNTRLKHLANMHNTERERTGENRYFNTPDAGWIEVARFDFNVFSPRLAV